MNQVILLKNRPKGKPSLQDFEFAQEERPQPKEDELLLETKYISVDPYLRGRMRDEKSYIPPFEVGKPLESGIIAEVIASNNKNFQKGDFVNGMLQWKQFQISNGNGLNKVDRKNAPLKAYLGVLGLRELQLFWDWKK